MRGWAQLVGRPCRWRARWALPAVPQGPGFALVGARGPGGHRGRGTQELSQYFSVFVLSQPFLLIFLELIVPKPPYPPVLPLQAGSEV
jgi:hypothetical protein